AEPLETNHLSGLTGAGQYLLLRFTAQQGLVYGAASNSNGQASVGVPVRILGQPWLTFTDASGAYRLLAPTGAVQVAAMDLQTGDAAIGQVTVLDTQLPVLTDLTTAPTGPQVVAVSPTNTATGVPRVTSIVVTFSKPVNPATLLS